MSDRTKKSADRISRRTVLRGAGVTMALPWLESLPAFADTNTGRRSRSASPFCSWAMASTRITGTRKGSGADMKLSKTLEPLEPLKHKINVIHGLFQKRATGQGIHPAQTGSLLSGAQIQKGAIIHAGITVDQMIANHIGAGHAAVEHRAGLRAADDGLSRDELLDGLQLAHLVAEPGFAGAERSLPVAGVGQPVRESRQPAQHEHSRSRDGRRRGAHAARSAPTDKAKLDEYLTSVREVEKRVDGMRKSKDQAEDLAKQKNRPVFSMDRPANGLPEDLRDHARLMCDIIAIAFQTDKTRVAIAAAGARPFGAVLSVPRGQGRPSRGVAQQQLGRLRAHRALPPEPARLSRDQAGQHAGRRRHGAR